MLLITLFSSYTLFIFKFHCIHHSQLVRRRLGPNSSRSLISSLCDRFNITSLQVMCFYMLFSLVTIPFNVFLSSCTKSRACSLAIISVYNVFVQSSSSTFQRYPGTYYPYSHLSMILCLFCSASTPIRLCSYRTFSPFPHT